MKKLLIFLLLFLNYPAWAHHTKDHAMLMENTDQVINMTQQGADNSWLWIIWAGVAILIALGVFRLMNKK
ncbi:MAG: hypothetical protein GWO88_00445 [Planctomycetia bacterium]|nr:hypothetical protein [Planctomycetia bacterium]